MKLPRLTTRALVAGVCGLWRESLVCRLGPSNSFLIVLSCWSNYNFGTNCCIVAFYETYWVFVSMQRFTLRWFILRDEYNNVFGLLAKYFIILSNSACPPEINKYISYPSSLIFVMPLLFDANLGFRSKIANWHIFQHPANKLNKTHIFHFNNELLPPKYPPPLPSVTPNQVITPSPILHHPCPRRHETRNTHPRPRCHPPQKRQRPLFRRPHRPSPQWISQLDQHPLSITTHIGQIEDSIWKSQFWNRCGCQE